MVSELRISTRINQQVLVLISSITTINIGNVGYIGNIGLKISRQYRVNIALGFDMYRNQLIFETMQKSKPNHL